MFSFYFFPTFGNGIVQYIFFFTDCFIHKYDQKTLAIEIDSFNGCHVNA